MKEFRVTRKDITISYTYIKADNWVDAEEKAHLELTDDDFEYCHGETEYDTEEVE